MAQKAGASANRRHDDRVQGGSRGQGHTTPSDTSCPDLDSTCGGDPTGTWDIEGICYEMPATVITGNPNSAFYECEGLTVDLTFEGGGTFTIEQDGTYASTTTGVLTFTIEVPTTCLNGKSCAAAAAVFTDTSYTTTATETGNGCTIFRVSEQGTDTDDGNVKASKGSYCVQGDSLVTASEDSNGTTALGTFKRR